MKSLKELIVTPFEGKNDKLDKGLKVLINNVAVSHKLVKGIEEDLNIEFEDFKQVLKNMNEILVMRRYTNDSYTAIKIFGDMLKSILGTNKEVFNKRLKLVNTIIDGHYHSAIYDLRSKIKKLIPGSFDNHEFIISPRIMVIIKPYEDIIIKRDGEIKTFKIEYEELLKLTQNICKSSNEQPMMFRAVLEDKLTNDEIPLDSEYAYLNAMKEGTRAMIAASIGYQVGLELERVKTVAREMKKLGLLDTMLNYIKEVK